jgi:hypothetical protein
MALLKVLLKERKVPRMTRKLVEITERKVVQEIRLVLIIKVLLRLVVKMKKMGNLVRPPHQLAKVKKERVNPLPRRKKKREITKRGWKIYLKMLKVQPYLSM